jgi:hypothetical protein
VPWHFRRPLPLILLPLGANLSHMERKFINQSGSVITISVSKWPGEFMMNIRYSDGRMHIMFIKDVEAEVEMLLVEGYMEEKE